VVVVSFFIDALCSCNHSGGFGGCHTRKWVPGSWVSSVVLSQARAVKFCHLRPCFPGCVSSIHPSIVDPLINGLCAGYADLLRREKSDQRTGERHCIGGQLFPKQNPSPNGLVFASTALGPNWEINIDHDIGIVGGNRSHQTRRAFRSSGNHRLPNQGRMCSIVIALPALLAHHEDVKPNHHKGWVWRSAWKLQDTERPVSVSTYLVSELP
jgi:hypothetical protein